MHILILLPLLLSSMLVMPGLAGPLSPRLARRTNPDNQPVLDRWTEIKSLANPKVLEHLEYAQMLRIIEIYEIKDQVYAIESKYETQKSQALSKWYPFDRFAKEQDLDLGQIDTQNEQLARLSEEFVLSALSADDQQTDRATFAEGGMAALDSWRAEYYGSDNFLMNNDARAERAFRVASALQFLLLTRPKEIANQHTREWMLAAYKDLHNALSEVSQMKSRSPSRTTSEDLIITSFSLRIMGGHLIFARQLWIWENQYQVAALNADVYPDLARYCQTWFFYTPVLGPPWDIASPERIDMQATLNGWYTTQIKAKWVLDGRSTEEQHQRRQDLETQLERKPGFEAAREACKAAWSDEDKRFDYPAILKLGITQYYIHIKQNEMAQAQVLRHWTSLTLERARAWLGSHYGREAKDLCESYFKELEEMSQE